MSLALALANGRRAAESLMVDSCTLRRKTGEVLDEDPQSPTYLQMIPTWDVVYTGKCRVQITASVTREPDAGGREWSVQSLVLQLPVESSTGVKIDDVATIDAATNDPALAGRELQVVQDFTKTHATSRRLQCEEVTA